MSPASLSLLALVAGLFFVDYATLRRRGRRMLLVEGIAFVVGGFFIAVPDAATALAHRVGIGRGVDFVLYPLVIWLVREALVSRQLRFEDNARLTGLVRAIALRDATAVPTAGGRDECIPLAGEGVGALTGERARDFERDAADDVRIT